MKNPVLQNSVYDKILELPLFQGHSREDLTAILSKVRVEFGHYKKGQTILRQDDPCKSIIFLIDGEVVASRTSLHKDILFSEQFGAFRSFGTETLFGLRQSFSYSITALSEVNTLVVDKAGVTSRLLNYEVFRYNLLNMLTTRIQRCQQVMWLPEEDDVERSFVLLCKRNFIHPAGFKTIEGGMMALARMMNRPRIHVSNMLNALESRQLISLGRKKITIPNFEKLINPC
jgi:CRP-like cAMP-binding protein